MTTGLVFHTTRSSAPVSYIFSTFKNVICREEFGGYPCNLYFNYNKEVLRLIICARLFCDRIQRVDRHSSVGIAAHNGLNGPEIITRLGASFSAPVQTSPMVRPASYITGTGSFPRVKRPERGIERPSHLAPKLKKEQTIPHFLSGPP